MKYYFWLPLLAFILLGTSCSTMQAESEIPKGCSDFLAGLNKKPEKLKFEGCKSENLHQLKALKAEYTVDGESAKEVEKKLVKDFNLKPLGFACCGWESLPASYVGSDSHFEIQMSSGETLEKDWNKIKAFRVSVYKLLELP